MKFKKNGKFFKSLRFRILIILIILGIVPSVIVTEMVIANYEDRAIANKVWDRYFLNMDVAPARYTVVAPTVAEPYLFEITCVAGV